MSDELSSVSSHSANLTSSLGTQSSTPSIQKDPVSTVAQEALKLSSSEKPTNREWTAWKFLANIISSLLKLLSRKNLSSEELKKSAEDLHNLRVRRFSGLFWPLFDSNCRGSIRELIQPRQFEVENRLEKNPKIDRT